MKGEDLVKLLEDDINKIIYSFGGAIAVSGAAYVNYSLLDIAHKSESYIVPLIVGMVGGYLIGKNKDNLEKKVKERTLELEEKTEKLNIELEENKRLLEYSYKDALTGVGNRRLFDQVLYDELMRSQRELTSLSLILTDIDFFKDYNDYYGHLDGDRCLCSVAKALEESVSRPADTVTRYGGEEFGIILPNTSMNGAMKVAGRIMYKLNELHIPHKASKVCDFVSLSLGIVTKNFKSNYCPEELFHIADGCLYDAKNKGRNQFITMEV